MVHETDNAERRIAQTGDAITRGDGAVTEAYTEMAAQSRQQRTERQTGTVAGNPTDYLLLTDPFAGLQATPPPRMDRLQPIPAPPIEIDHEAARRRGEEGDRLAQQRLNEASRRRQSRVPH